jgi:hypothetical protein
MENRDATKVLIAKFEVREGGSKGLNCWPFILLCSIILLSISIIFSYVFCFLHPCSLQKLTFFYQFTIPLFSYPISFPSKITTKSQS